MKKILISAVTSMCLVTSALSSEQLADIIVTSVTKSNQSISDVTSNVNVITKEELEEKHIKTLQEALNLVSGVQLVSNGGVGANSTLMLRGTSNNRVLVLIDGIRYKDHSSISGTNVSHILIQDIERIELVKGAQSGVWGADAAAGVINIITKAAKEGFHGSAQIEIGSYNTRQAIGSLSYKTDKYDAKLTANRLTSDSFSSQSPKNDDPKQYEDDSYENTTLNAKVGYNFTDDARLALSYTNIDAKKDYDGFNAPNDETKRSIVDNNLYSAVYTQALNNHFITAKFDGTKFEREEKGATFGVKQTEGKSRQFEINDKFSYIKDGFLVFGAGVSKEEATFLQVSGTRDNKESKSQFIYATNSNKFEKLILTQSLRYDNYKNFDNKTTGKLGAKYNFTKDLNVFANYGTAYTVPLIVYNVNPFGTPNPNLQPEETKSVDFGVEYKGLKVTAFHSQVKDLIQWSGTGYENVQGESTFKGVEVEYAQSFAQDFLWTNSFTRLSAKNDDDENLARRARFTYKSSLDYYVLHNLHINLNANYVGTRYDGSNDTGEQTGRYTLWNSAVNYDINSQFKVYAKLDNITDKKYQVVDGYATAGRSIFVGLKANF